jgi:N-acetylmuramoyl-L-alanine amidase
MRTASQRLALMLPLVLSPSLADRAEARAVDRAAAECLALALYFEARAEGADGMQAVAAVVLNRVRHPGFPNDVCAVIRDGGEQPPCQFSWWCDGRSDHPTEPEAWARAQQVASHVLEHGAPDRTRGALFFHTTDIKTPWRKRREPTARIGRHIFYR